MSEVTRWLKSGARRLGLEVSRYDPSASVRPDWLVDAWFAKIAREEAVRTVFDVGANHGRAVKWLRRCFPSAMIHAFEPHGPAFEALRAATAEDPKVEVHRLALGSARGSAELNVNANDVTNSLLPTAAGTERFEIGGWDVTRGRETVRVETLEAFCSDRGIEIVDVMKLGVQGYEREVLRGAGPMFTPSRLRSLFLELNFVNLYEGQVFGDELLTELRHHGYKLFGLTNVAFDMVNGWKWADAMILPA